MEPPQNNVDENGFPQRSTFDESTDSSERAPTRIPWRWVIFGTPLVVLLIAAVVYGPDLYTLFLMNRAVQRMNAQQDFEGALTDLDRAVSLSDNRDTRVVRGLIQMSRGDQLTTEALEAAVKDFDAAVEREPGLFSTRPLWEVRVLQAQALQLLSFKVPEQADGLHKRALEAYDGAIELAEQDSKSPTPTIGKLQLANLYNGRAYTRAVAGRQLEGGLEDINAALNLLKLDTSQTASDQERSRAAFLDTRGYLYVRLGQGKEALADLEEAVKLARDSRPQVLKETQAIGASAGGILLLEQQLKETEAVLLHHRGEAHQLLGNEKEAKDDIAEAEQLGYDPANGVF